MNSNNANMLGTALYGNAIFSALSGILMLVASKQAAELTGITPPLVFIVIGCRLARLGCLYPECTSQPPGLPSHRSMEHHWRRPGLGSSQRSSHPLEPGAADRSRQMGHRHHRRHGAAIRNLAVLWLAAYSK